MCIQNSKQYYLDVRKSSCGDKTRVRARNARFAIILLNGRARPNNLMRFFFMVSYSGLKIVQNPIAFKRIRS